MAPRARRSCAQLLSVDENVGRILDALDATHQPYVVALSADHGGHDAPERIRKQGVPDAARVDAALLPANMSKQLAANSGLRGRFLSARTPQVISISAQASPKRPVPRVLEAAKAHYLAHPQVATVFTSAELRRMASPSEPPDEWSPSPNDFARVLTQSAREI